MGGKIICIGLGPGDPELMSVKAHRILSTARYISYFRKSGKTGVARQMVEGLLPEGVGEYAMEYPITTEAHFESAEYTGALSSFYAEAAERLKALAASGDVVVLCEGDPYLYGSFMHLQARLPAAMVEVVPGMPGMVGCWHATGQPITWGDDVLTVLPATLPEPELARRIKDSDALVVMKIGRNLPRLRRALEAAGRLEEAWLVERGTMPGERVRMLKDVADEVPYFAIAILHGKGRRP